MSDPYIAQIVIMPYLFAPRGWSDCQGQLIAINQNQALFSLIGSIYGGDGRTTLALPDMQGRIGLQSGHGMGLSTYRLGQMGGAENHTLLPHEMAAHTHNFINEFGPDRNSKNPGGNYLTNSRKFYEPTHEGAETLAGVPDNTSEATGDTQPHENRMPYQVLNFCIAMTGLYPARN